MKDLCAWAVPAILCFALYLLALSLKMHTRNWCFFAWLCLGVGVQLAFCTGLALHSTKLVAELAGLDDAFGILLAFGSVIEAAYRLGWLQKAADLKTRSALHADPVNSAIFWWMLLLLALDGLCLMATRTGFGLTALNAVGGALSAGRSIARAQAWLANIAFYVPAMGLLVAFSGTHFDRLLAFLGDSVQGPAVREALGYARSIFV